MGISGVLVYSLLFMFILIFFRKSNTSKNYFGIFFAYIYIINTSFIELLLITHGLLFFLISAFIFFQKEIHAVKT